jgi:hypothetical protein
MEGVHSAGSSPVGSAGMARTKSGRPQRNFGRLSQRSGFVSCRFDGVVPKHVAELQAAMEPRDVTMKMVNMTAGGDIDAEVFEWIEHCDFFIIMGSEEYGENTGNSACTYNEAKFAQGKGKHVILIRMIPFQEQFKHLQARVMFGLNKLEVLWMLGTPMPAELPDVLMQAMGLPLLPAPKSPSTPVHENEHWPDELAELMSIPEFVACLAELDVHKMEDVIDVIDAEEGHDKLLMAVLEALPTKPRKMKLFRNRAIMAAQSLLRLLAVFIEYDTDDDGFLSHIECARIPVHKAVAKSGGVVGEAFGAMDINKDGRISFEELFEYCKVVGEEGVPPPDVEAEMKVALAAAAREKAAHEEMQAMKLEQVALAAAQREQAAAEASQAALAQQRAQIEEQAEQLRRQQLKFERKSQAAAVEAQRKLDEASRQLELQAKQQAEQLEAALVTRAITIPANPKYRNLSMRGYREQALFHQINVNYPGLQLVKEKPYIFIVNNFMTPDECARLRTKGEKRGQRSRGSTGGNGCKCVVMYDEEIPALRKRFADLTATQEAQLQPLQVSSYEPGKAFGRHVDSHWGVATVNSQANPAGSKDDFFNERGRAEKGIRELKVPYANRFMTVFVYLKDVAEGGRTRFRWTGEDPSFYDSPGMCDPRAIPWSAPDDENGVAVVPQTGLAVIHFGATTPETGGISDRNTAHESEAVVGEDKWICQQFIYSHPLADYSGIGSGDLPEKDADAPDMSDVL